MADLADALGQHHELARGGDLGGRCVLLQLERRDRLGDLQQVRGLAVDGAQRLPHLGQDLLLRQHGVGVLLGALDQRDDRARSCACTRRRARRPDASRLPSCEATHVARQHVGAFPHLGKGGRAADQGLRHRLGQALRLHQCLTGGGHLLSRPVGGIERRKRRPHTSTDQPNDQQASQQRAAGRRSAQPPISGTAAAAGGAAASASPCLDPASLEVAGARGCDPEMIDPASAKPSASADCRRVQRQRAIGVGHQRQVGGLVGVFKDTRRSCPRLGAKPLQLELAQKAHRTLSNSRCRLASVLQSRRAGLRVRRAMRRNISVLPSQRLQVQFLPDAPLRIDHTRCRQRPGASSAVARCGLQLRPASRRPTRRSIQQRGIHAERRVERDQARPDRAPSTVGRAAARRSRPDRPRRADRRAGWPRRGTRAGCTAPAATGAHGKISPAWASGSR